MLYTTVSSESKNAAYKKLVQKLNAGEDKEEICRKIKEFCENCRPSNPITCMELCEIWGLKKELRETLEALDKKPNLTDLLNLLQDKKYLRILEILIENPCSQKELKNRLESTGITYKIKILCDEYITPLVDAELIVEEAGLIRLTSNGKSIYNIITKNEIAEISLNFQGYEEKILGILLTEPKSYEDLETIIPTTALYRSLSSLQKQGLIEKSDLSGVSLFFKTKRRPTRKLPPSEIAIFKALPKEGISAKDLSEKVGMKTESVYKHLRLLRYKRHVRKVENVADYRLTEAGKCLAQSLNIT